MMRVAAINAAREGIQICWPVHDAFLIEAPTDRIGLEVERMQDVMRDASETVLPGFPLRTDADVYRYPDRYQDERGEKMWNLVNKLARKLEGTC
jgi:hypothetical protein